MAEHKITYTEDSHTGRIRSLVVDGSHWVSVAEANGMVSAARADERSKAHVHATGTSSEDGPCCECCYTSGDLRRLIASQIRSHSDTCDHNGSIQWNGAIALAADIAAGKRT